MKYITITPATNGYILTLMGTDLPYEQRIAKDIKHASFEAREMLQKIKDEERPIAEMDGCKIYAR